MRAAIIHPIRNRDAGIEEPPSAEEGKTRATSTLAVGVGARRKDLLKRVPAARIKNQQRARGNLN